jgi:hypothetical protein
VGGIPGGEMSKYGNRKVTIDGYHFDSLREGARYQELRLLEKAGEITNLTVHPVFLIQDGFVYHGKKIRKVTYEADFEYWDPFFVHDIVIEDVKGVQTEAFKIKWKLALNLFPEYDWRIVTK